MQVVAILPCRGRKEQTLECVRRLLATEIMQHGIDWRLVVVSGTDDSDIVESIAQSTNIHGLVAEKPRLSYWEALQYGTNEFPADYYVCLANDLLPAVRWLTSAMEKMQETFSDGVGVVGFNGDGHQTNHACHLMISSKLLDELADGLFGIITTMAIQKYACARVKWEGLSKHRIPSCFTITRGFLLKKMMKYTN